MFGARFYIEWVRINRWHDKPENPCIVMPIFDGLFAKSQCGVDFIEQVKEFGLRLGNFGEIILPDKNYEDSLFERIKDFNWKDEQWEEIVDFPSLLIFHRNSTESYDWQQFDPQEQEFVHVHLARFWSDDGNIQSRELAEFLRRLEEWIVNSENLQHKINDDQVLWKRKKLRHSIGASLNILGLNFDIKNILGAFYR